MVTVRLFAAARDAAGTDIVLISAAGTVGEGLAELGLGEQFARVLAVCSLLSGGRLIGLSERVADDSVVDVLPPFAGG